jgi:HlyD family secretion protein
MKTFYFFLLIPFFATSCGNGNNKSDAFGNFEATEVLVGAEAQGKIMQLNIEEGQFLKKGVPVGYIDSLSTYLKMQQLNAQVQASEARLSQVQAQVNVQEEQKKTLVREQDRVSKLVSSGAAPTKQLDDINSQLNLINSQITSTKTQNLSISAEIKALKYQAAQVQDQLNKSSIFNPIEGTVLEKYIETGEIAMPGKTLYKIADLSTLKLRVYISGEQLPNIKIGQRVAVFIDKNESENKQLEGVISWISQQAEFTPKIIQTKEERVNLVYAVKVDVKNDGSLKIGMPGEVKFNY